LAEKGHGRGLFLAAVLSAVLSVSCGSVPLMLPGGKAAVVGNIYSEYLNIGDIYFSLEKYDRAAACYELALDGRSNYWGTYYKLARSRAMNSEWDKAGRMYGRLLERDPDNMTLLSSKAYICAMSGDAAGAAEIYSSLVSRQPESSEYLEDYIAVLLMDGDVEGAEAPLALLRRDFPDSANIRKFDSQVSAVIEERKKDADASAPQIPPDPDSPVSSYPPEQ